MLGKAWVMENDVFDGSGDLVKNILRGRGFESDPEIKKFLNPSIKEYMPDPAVLQDMDVAARIIADAVQNNQKIAIYGDYDVDGITSTAVFVKYLRAAGADVVWHLPTREGEGYGLNNQAIDEIVQLGANLLVTVDCGISGIEEVILIVSHSKLEILNSSEGILEIEEHTEMECEEESHEHHHHGEVNSHIWVSIPKYITQVKNISKILI